MLQKIMLTFLTLHIFDHGIEMDLSHYQLTDLVALTTGIY